MNTTCAENRAVTMYQGLPQMGDAMLVAAARAGDLAAFDQLTLRHSRRILNRIYRIVGNWQDAEDVLQDSLMKAFLHLNTFEFKANFSTWFTSIAINTALMLLRKKRRYVETTIDSSPDGPEPCERLHLMDKSENPEQRYAREQRACILRSAVLQLRSSTRSVLELHQTTDLSLKEIARSLGISESAAKSRLNRARIELRTTMKPKLGYSRARHASAGNEPSTGSEGVRRS